MKISFCPSANLGMHRNVKMADGEEKLCMAACNTQTYDLLLTTSNYPSFTTFKYTKTFCYLVKKLMRSCDSTAKNKSISKGYGPELCQLIGKLQVHWSFPNTIHK